MWSWSDDCNVQKCHNNLDNGQRLYDYIYIYRHRYKIDIQTFTKEHEKMVYVTCHGVET